MDLIHIFLNIVIPFVILFLFFFFIFKFWKIFKKINLNLEETNKKLEDLKLYLKSKK